MFAVSPDPIDAEALRRHVVSPSAGAVVVFHGTVRGSTRGRAVRFLEYEAYASMAEAAMAAIAARIVAERGLVALACQHRVGRLALGETAVVVAASAPHRASALAAVEDFVVALKRDVPVWKKEHFEDGAVWVGAPDDPQAARAAGGDAP